MRQLITVSLGGADKAVITAVKLMPWDVFARALTTEPPETTDKAARGWYIPATFDGPRRHGDNFVSRGAITFDFDHVNIDTWGLVQLGLQAHAFAMYTTFSHTYDAPRFRVVIPLSRPVSEDEYQAISRRLAADLGIDLLARESFTPAQMMYLPTRKLGGAFEGFVSKSDVPIDADEVLDRYADWTDRKQWPRRKDEQEFGTGEHSDPREKPGLIGEFNRRFSVPEAIARFDLPYVPTVNPNRYTYTKGSVAEGVVIYDDGLKFHSHHDTDPCRGQHNCFDLVRITRFGHLDDAERDQGLGPTDRPSYRAMVAFIRQQPEFRPTAADEFMDLRDQQQGTESDQSGAGAGAGSSGSGGVVPQESGGGVDGDQSHRDGSGPESNAGESERFLVREAADFSDGPPLDWIVRRVLPRAELAVIYGESGSGKSFLALDLLTAITRGTAWRGLRVGQGPGLYICAEGAGGFKARLRAYARGHNVPLHQLPAVIGEAPNLLDEKDAAVLFKAILRWGKKPSVIVIDTFSATTPGGDENSGQDVGKVIHHCKLLHKYTGALVVLIHHSGKDSTKGARGWSGLRAAADAEIEITRNGDFRTATVTKMKDGGDFEKFTFKLKPIELDPLDDEPQSSCIIEHVDAPTGQTAAKPPLKGLPKIIHDTLAIMAPTGTCHYEDLIKGVMNKIPKKDGPRDLRRQEIRSAVTRSLISGGYAFMHGEDRISLTNLQHESAQEWIDEVT